MPGMLTAEQMAELAAANGEAFDRLFLALHDPAPRGRAHDGGRPVQDPGAGQEGDINAFAADVDADQRMEIDRMRAMLGIR